jgi:hypothetical protein
VDDTNWWSLIWGGGSREEKRGRRRSIRYSESQATEDLAKFPRPANHPTNNILEMQKAKTFRAIKNSGSSY